MHGFINLSWEFIIYALGFIHDDFVLFVNWISLYIKFIFIKLPLLDQLLWLHMIRSLCLIVTDVNPQ